MATKRSRKKKQESKPAAKKTIKGRTRPILGLFLFALGVLSFAALLSFDIIQSSDYNTNPVSHGNWVGIAGANFAGLALAVVGIGSWFIPVYLTAFAWVSFFGLRKRLGWIKVSLLVALPFMLCALGGGFGEWFQLTAVCFLS